MTHQQVTTRWPVHRSRTAQFHFMPEDACGFVPAAIQPSNAPCAVVAVTIKLAETLFYTQRSRVMLQRTWRRLPQSVLPEHDQVPEVVLHDAVHVDAGGAVEVLGAQLRRLAGVFERANQCCARGNVPASEVEY